MENVMTLLCNVGKIRFDYIRGAIEKSRIRSKHVYRINERNGRNSCELLRITLRTLVM